MRAEPAASLSMRQLRNFVAVAEVGSITRAAAQLFVAQPALSYQIKRLERQLGVPLFKREGRGIALTDEGRQLLEHAKATLREHDALLDRAASLPGLQYGRLRVGFIAQGPGELLPKALRIFRHNHPNTAVSLYASGFDDCFVGVTRDITDVGFVMGPPDDNEDVAVQPLLDEPVVVAMADDHPFATRRRLKIDEILNEPLLTDIHPPGRWRDYWDANGHRSGLEPRIAGRFATHDEWLESLCLGGGISLCPESTPHYFPRSGLTFVPLDGMAPITHSIVWRKTNTSQIVKDFVKVATDITRSATR